MFLAIKSCGVKKKIPSFYALKLWSLQFLGWSAEPLWDPELYESLVSSPLKCPKVITEECWSLLRCLRNDDLYVIKTWPQKGGFRFIPHVMPTGVRDLLSVVSLFSWRFQWNLVGQMFSRRYKWSDDFCLRHQCFWNINCKINVWNYRFLKNKSHLKQTTFFRSWIY